MNDFSKLPDGKLTFREATEYVAVVGGFIEAGESVSQNPMRKMVAIGENLAVFSGTVRFGKRRFREFIEQAKLDNDGDSNGILNDLERFVKVIGKNVTHKEDATCEDERNRKQ